MIDLEALPELTPAPLISGATAAHVAFGVTMPKQSRISIFSPDEWEAFTQEWLSTRGYVSVKRLAGAGDMGLDVIATVTTEGFKGDWDNYQCKRLTADPIPPNKAWPEISKVIYYTFKDEYTVPRKYYFVGSRGIGTTLEKLFQNHDKLKEQAELNWNRQISPAIDAPLEGDLKRYFDAFDFSIFSSKSPLEMVEEHSTTPFHAVRFGGGLPARPLPEKPPEVPGSHESRYITQIFQAYSDHLKTNVTAALDLEDNSRRQLKNDYSRQRERFYHAESLRNFSRDTVPNGTFESLQDEVYYAVAEVCDRDYTDALERMRETLIDAARITTPSNPLASVVVIPDRQGICHQLANEDRLTWVKGDSNEDDTL